MTLLTDVFNKASLCAHIASAPQQHDMLVACKHRLKRLDFDEQIDIAAWLSSLDCDVEEVMHAVSVLVCMRTLPALAEDDALTYLHRLGAIVFVQAVMLAHSVACHCRYVPLPLLDHSMPDQMLCGKKATTSKRQHLFCMQHGHAMG